jgi:hypothetical protein
MIIVEGIIVLAITWLIIFKVADGIQNLPWLEQRRLRKAYEAAKNWPPKRAPEMTPATYRVVYTDGKSEETRLSPNEIEGWAVRCNNDNTNRRKPYQILPSPTVGIERAAAARASSQVTSGLDPRAWDMVRRVSPVRCAISNRKARVRFPIRTNNPTCLESRTTDPGGRRSTTRSVSRSMQALRNCLQYTCLARRRTPVFV